MSSLLTTASSWNSGDVPPKKRVPSMKKIFQQKFSDTKDKIEGFSGSSFGSSSGSSIDESELSNIPTNSLQSTLIKQTGNKQIVHSIIDKMTTLSENNAGSNLPDFKPMQESFESEMPNAPIVINGGVGGDIGVSHSSSSSSSVSPQSTIYAPSYNLGGNYASYQNAYNQRIPTPTNVNISAGVREYGSSVNGGLSNEKLMERVNYMIRLLEEQKMEKTNYVMEEFIMYTFLGVFMVYVCDSFASYGKYTR